MGPDEGGGQGPPGISGLCRRAGAFGVTWHPVGALNSGALHDPPANCGVEGRRESGAQAGRDLEGLRLHVAPRGAPGWGERGGCLVLRGVPPSSTREKDTVPSTQARVPALHELLWFLNHLPQALETDGEAWPFLHTSRPGAQPRGRRGSLYTPLRARFSDRHLRLGETGGGWGMSRNPRAAPCGWWLEVSVPVAEAVTAVRQRVMGPWSPAEIRVTP